MAIIYWRGDDIATAQITEWAFSGTWEADDIVAVTCNGKTVNVTAGSTSVSTILDNVVSALNGLSATVYPEFYEIIWSKNGTSLRATARTAGKPFTVALATTESGGTTADDQVIGSASTVQASRGPNHVDSARNYSGGSLPTNGDTLVITASNVSLLYGLDALSAVTLDALIIDQSFTGTIGLPDYDQTGNYYQYRPKFLQVGSTEVTIGAGEGAGSARIKLDLGSVESSIRILNSGQSATAGLRAIHLKGTHADNELNVMKGSVDVAMDEGAASTIKTLRVSFVDNVQSDADVRIGAGVTLNDVVQSGGKLLIQSDTDSLILRDGTCTYADGEPADVVVTGGIFDWRTTGEVGALSVSNGRVECSKDPRPKAFDSSSQIELYRGAILNDPLGTLPAGIKVVDNTGGVTINRNAGTLYELT